MEADRREETRQSAVREPVDVSLKQGDVEARLGQEVEETRSYSQGGAVAGAPEQARAGAGAGHNLTGKPLRGLGGRLAALLKRDDYHRVRPQRGKVYEATLLTIGEHDMVVDLGAKRDGVIPPKDLDLISDEEYLASLKVGQMIPVVVLKAWGHPDGILVSLNKGLQQQDWLRAREMLESEEVFEAEVVDVNRGGVLARLGRVQGFVPNSHLTSIPRGMRANRLREAKGDLVGQTLSLVVIEVNQRRRRLVLSERAADRQRREQLLEGLTEGDVRVGSVRNLVDFGAFVDLGGIDGLVHISELDWGRVEQPSEVLSVGDEVEVYVLKVDRDRERIALSRKRLLPDPWQQVVQELDVGDVVEGTITGVAPYGVFVAVGQGVEGLAHVSEMKGGEATLTKTTVGCPVTVRIVNIDQWQQRMLSLIHI